MNKKHPQTHSWLQCSIHDWDTCALESFLAEMTGKQKALVSENILEDGFLF